MRNCKMFEKYAGFPLDGSSYFRIRGHRYRMNGAGLRAVLLALRIWECVEAQGSLFSFRGELRTLRQSSCTAALSHLAESATHATLRLIAIWLRGQCAGHIGTEIIAQFATHESERIRRAVAKALQHMEAWSILSVISQEDPCERVRRLASIQPTRDFQTRLRDFSKNTVSVAIRPYPHSLYVSPSLELQKPIRVKSVEFIRRILERIHHAVRIRIG